VGDVIKIGSTLQLITKTSKFFAILLFMDAREGRGACPLWQKINKFIKIINTHYLSVTCYS